MCVSSQKPPTTTIVNPLQQTFMPSTNPAPTPTGVFSPAHLTATTFTGGFQPPDYIENPAELEEDFKISDDVRNFWEPPHTEPGVPPLLTMPGIQTSSDLVFKKIIIVKCYQN